MPILIKSNNKEFEEKFKEIVIKRLYFLFEEIEKVSIKVNLLNSKDNYLFLTLSRSILDGPKDIFRQKIKRLKQAISLLIKPNCFEKNYPEIQLFPSGIEIIWKWKIG